jgi:P4 family phage/plasmid primase-like protien
LGNGKSPKAEPSPIADAFDEFFGGIPGNEDYAEKALNEECAGLAAMPPNSGRNSALNAKAYRLGRFVAAGYLSREVVERRLYEAACACGLDKDDNCGENGIWKTIASGIESGMQKPLEKQIDATEDEHGLTDDALALQLGAESWNKNARFVNTWNRWFFWNGTFWEPDETRMHERQCREFLRKKAGRLKELAAKTEDEKEAGRLVKAANMLRSEAVCRRVLTMARSNPASMASTDMWDWCPDIVGTPAGVIDLRTGNAKPAVREDYITRVTAVAPSADEPKRWIAFLTWAMRGDADMVAFLQRFLGYVLTGHVSEHVFAFLFGGGNNGKSTVINTVMTILGRLARKLPAETILASKNERHPTDLAGLVGARLAVCSEVPHGRQWNEAIVKDLTGGDMITARLMRQDYFDFRPKFKLMIAGNHQPGLASVDVAIRRRMLMIPFEAQVEPGHEDKRLGTKLAEESGAILNWMIQGAVEWYRDGLQPPEKVLCATDAYLEAEDELKRFIDETLEADHEASVPTRDLYDKYVAWATASGIRNPMPHKALARALRERGLEFKKVRYGSASVRALPGYRLKK